MRWTSVNWAMGLSEVVLFVTLSLLASFLAAMIAIPNPPSSIDPAINAQWSLRDILNLTWFIVGLLASIAFALLGICNEVKKLREQLEIPKNNSQ